MALKSGFFTEALRQYALVKSPSTQIPPSTLLIESPECIAIFDAYPKAKYHFLVLPRPFIPSGSTRPISTDDLDDLRSLLDMNKDARKEVVQAIRAMAEEVVEMVKDEMMKTEGFTWGVDMGFHAVPSMKHVHLHVISSDRISPALKTKKHYNSFRTDLAFFVHLSDVEKWIQSDRYITLPTDEILKTSLDCVTCGQTFPNMPALKTHLEQEWEVERKRALKG